MRIVVNDIAASTTGALSILKEFYNYVKEYGSGHEWIFLLSDEYVKETENIKIICMRDVKKSWKNRLKFDLVNGHNFIESLNPDVLFSMQNTMSFHYKGKQIIYVHQPLGFQKEKVFSLFKSEEREYAIYQHIIGRLIDISIKKSDHVIVQTKWMKEAIIKKLKIKEDRISNILPSLEALDGYRIQECPDRESFFYPSGDIIYKNHETIYKAVRILIKEGISNFKIYLTLNDKEFLELLGKASKGDSESDKKEILSHFVCMGRIDRSEVFRFYQNSVLLFPSYIETFGYPLSEARAIGTIAIASDCPFSRELLEGYNNAYFFNPFDDGRLAELMRDYILGRIEFHNCESQEENNIKNNSAINNEVSSWKQVVDIIESC